MNPCTVINDIVNKFLACRNNIEGRPFSTMQELKSCKRKFGLI